MASKDEELHLARSKLFEGGIHTLGSLTTEIFSQIGTECKIDNLIVLRCVPMFVGAPKLGNDIPIHATSNVPLNKRSKRFQSIGWIWFVSKCTPANLVAKCSSYVAVNIPTT